MPKNNFPESTPLNNFSQPNKKMKTKKTALPIPPHTIKNGKTFLAKFIGPTNSRGARVKISFESPSSKDYPTLTHNWDYEASQETYTVAFLKYLATHEAFYFDRQEGERFEIVKSYTPQGYYFTASVVR
jgi:hypothetical protein